MKNNVIEINKIKNVKMNNEELTFDYGGQTYHFTKDVLMQFIVKLWNIDKIIDYTFDIDDYERK